MNLEQRLDKVSKHLTPKQAVVLYLQEIQPFQNATEYVHYLRGQPESAAPITRLTEQVDKAIREEMRGQKKELIEPAVRRAVKDVVFLVKLHLQANFQIMSKIRERGLSQIGLAETLRCLHVELLLRNVIAGLEDQVNFQTPYPLEPDIAAAVEAAIHNHVHTFQALIDESYICDWLWEYLINQGAKELPLSASVYVDGEKHPNVTPENEAEIRACFNNDEDKFELFKSGKDYTCDLASLTDAEYNQHYDTIVNAIRELVKSGQVLAGRTINLETIPIPFLQEVPLVEGKWLDRKAIELAEWGAFLQSQGYQLKATDDQPLLAPIKFLKVNGTEAKPEEVREYQQKAVRHLAKFPGRTKNIADRQYIHFEDYCSWRGRKVKGDLQSLVKDGLITASWNQWVINHQKDGKSLVGEISVAELNCSVDESDYYTCQRGIEKRLRNRKQLREDFRTWSFKPDRKEDLVQEWKEAVHYCLVELCAFRQAVTSIQNSYFEGQPILFPDVARDLAVLIPEAEATVNDFNSSFSVDVKLFQPIDLEAIHSNANQEVNRVMAYIVDMAKAEALDCLGEGDRGVALVERYL